MIINAQKLKKIFQEINKKKLLQKKSFYLPSNCFVNKIFISKKKRRQVYLITAKNRMCKALCKIFGNFLEKKNMKKVVREINIILSFRVIKVRDHIDEKYSKKILLKK